MRAEIALCAEIAKSTQR